VTRPTSWRVTVRNLGIGLMMVLMVAAGALAGDVSIPLPEGAIARCGMGQVHDVECSSDGRIVVLSTSLGVELLDRETFEMVGFFGDPLTYTVQAALSPDGEVVAAATVNGTVLLWDASGGELLRSLACTRGPITDLAFSPDGAILAVGSFGRNGGALHLWDAASGEELLTMNEPWLSGALAFSPDVVHLALGGEDGLVRLMDVRFLSIVREIEPPDASRSDTACRERSFITSLAYSSSGERLAAGSLQRTALLWNVETWETLPSPPCETAPVEGVCFAPDERSLGYWTDNDVVVWNLEDNREIGRQAFFHSVVYGDDREERGRPVFWEPAGLLYDANSATLVQISEGHEVMRWSPETGESEAIDRKGISVSTEALAFSPDGATLAVGSRQQDAKLWEWSPSASLTLRLVPALADELRFFPGGNRVLAKYSCGIAAWDMEDQRFLDASFGESGCSATCMDVSPDGTMVAIGSSDGVVTVWDARTYVYLATVGQMGMLETDPTSVAFSQDASILAVCHASGLVRFWRTESWTQIGEAETSSVCIVSIPGKKAFRATDCFGRIVELDGEIAQEANSRRSPSCSDPWDDLEASRDGSVGLATKGTAAMLIWRWGSEERWLFLSGHTFGIDAAALSPDGTLLATASLLEGTILLWDVDLLLHGE